MSIRETPTKIIFTKLRRFERTPDGPEAVWEDVYLLHYADGRVDEACSIPGEWSGLVETKARAAA